MTSQPSDAPQNLVQFQRWRETRGAWNCDDHYLAEVDRKWRSIGRQVRTPASLRNAENHN